MSPINICIIKQITTSYPSVFEDTAHCIAHLLRNAGFPNIISYNTIDPGIVNIIIGVGAGNTVPLDRFREIAKPNKTIIFNLEQINSTSSFISKSYINLLSDYITLDYNQSNISAMSAITGKQINTLEFPLVPSLELTHNPHPIEGKKIEYDFAFYGALNQSRSEKIKQLEAMGFKIKHISRTYGEFLTDAIIDCKTVLNLHYYESSSFETSRALRPTALGIPMISEPSILPKTVNWKESGVFFTGENFCADAANTVRNPEKLIELSRKSILFTQRNDWKAIANDVTKKTLLELKNQ